MLQSMLEEPAKDLQMWSEISLAGEKSYLENLWWIGSLCPIPYANTVYTPGMLPGEPGTVLDLKYSYSLNCKWSNFQRIYWA